MHKIPLTQLEEDGLRAHGLDIGSPSQLSDVFRHGIKWALEQTAPQPERSGLNDDSKEAAMQKAFELGGLEDGSYHLESDELELVIRAALSAQGESHE